MAKLRIIVDLKAQGQLVRGSLVPLLPALQRVTFGGLIQWERSPSKDPVVQEGLDLREWRPIVLDNEGLKQQVQYAKSDTVLGYVNDVDGCLKNLLKTGKVKSEDARVRQRLGV